MAINTTSKQTHPLNSSTASFEWIYHIHREMRILQLVKALINWPRNVRVVRASFELFIWFNIPRALTSAMDFRI